ncbi:RNA polymerase sigma factor [Pedobacter nutrimenti]|uniref:RNA polymerase sigma-70 factor (ECF subfamily) n=1 Tax=Pedobacter nutrimenti TaxID=1241337 RepID=A0A318ULH5_9SPHI|nr:RNA polymerase sigma factor [Pedobacter nutrimenti]PYF76741.1 RNA polymerase sigma-70 factor (ECF subfamily) [Pedobacter nutrimenti]
MQHREREFLTLIEIHKGIIHKMTRMYMDYREDQQDLFQEIICQLWNSFDSFKGNSKFSTWMYRVALNTAIVFLKKEKRKLDTSPELPENMAGEQDHSTEKEIQLKLFYHAVQQLDNIEKAIIFYHLENYSHREIGDNLGIMEGNVRVKLNRAKTKIKELIKKQGYEF